MKLAERVLLVVAGLGALAATGVLVTREKPAASAAGPAASGSAGAERAVPVATSVAARRDVPVFVEGLGTVTPIANITVKTQVDGRLDRVVYREGDDVRRGQVLAQVDPRPFLIQLEQGQGALIRDQANLVEQRRNLERFETLRKGNLISQQQVDDQRSLVGQLEGTVILDQATIDSAKLQLDYARIVSPVDGIAGIRIVDQGNIVHPTDTNGIAIVTQIDPISVIFTLPQDDLPRVQRAMALGPAVVEAYARDGSQKLGEGHLTVIDNQINLPTASMRMRAVMENPMRSLWPNLFVKARLLVETMHDALVVPAAAIQRGPTGSFAYVVAADKTVSSRPVDVELITGLNAVLGKGIEPGEVVVTEGQNQLRPGAKVAPRPPGPSAASSASPRSL